MWTALAGGKRASAASHRREPCKSLVPTTPVPNVQRTLSDINGDGFSDLVWTNPFNHQLGYSIMGLDGSGNVVRKGSAIFDTGAGRFVGAVGDFNGDRARNIVLTDSSRGEVSLDQ